MANRRADHEGQHRTQFEKNRRIILKKGGCCALCGQPVDVSIKDPSNKNPLAPVIDHIIPISRGGHPSDISNLQLAHRACNLRKADRLYDPTLKFKTDRVEVGMDELPLHCDWLNFRPKTA